MSHLEIRTAKAEDFEKVHKFIKMHWDGNPLYARYPEMMKYHHLDGENLNFVIAQEEGEIKGILGYIKYSQEERFDIGTAVWKTISSTHPLLGLEILDYLDKNVDTRICLGCGTKPQAMPLVKYLGWHVDYLNHYYRLADKEVYKVAVVNHKKILPVKETKYTLILIESIADLRQKFDATKYKAKKPYKDSGYIENRYFKHPMYQYKVYGIGVSEGEFSSIIVTREITQDGTKLLRIVDFVGEINDIKNLSMPIQKLMDKAGYEYVEFYNYGISEEIMEEAGFVRRTVDDSNIIPCYFEPYEQANVEISIVTTDSDGICIFKEDADQDFPRPIKE